MPTYEYECQECGARFDMFQSIKASARRKAECESCGCVRPVRRLIGTGGAVLFKGAGFYQTDYRSEGYKKAAKADAPDATKSSEGKAKKDASGDSKAQSADKSQSSNESQPSNKSQSSSKDTATAK